MVCIRCKMLVKDVLDRLAIRYSKVELGEVKILEPISSIQYQQLCLILKQSGLEVMDDEKSRLIQQIKDIITALVYEAEEPLPINLSHYLSQQLNIEYPYLASIFSASQGSTIELFFITKRIERVRELLLTTELSCTEISFLLHYSSVAHLSAQFKQITGLTPSRFKRSKRPR